MPNNARFAAVLQRLNSWREDVIGQLRDSSDHAEALTLKLQLDNAIATLELCERYRISPEATVTVLPDLRTMTPSCAYRVVEDNETDNQADWIELEINDYHLELSPGDIIIENSAAKMPSL